MYKELSSDIEGFKLPDHGYLMGWAKQGELVCPSSIVRIILDGHVNTN